MLFIKKNILLVAFSLILLLATATNIFNVVVVNGQTCQGNAGMTPTTGTYLCPVGYVNSKFTDESTGAISYQCKLVNEMSSAVSNAKPCKENVDCLTSRLEDPNVYSNKLRAVCSNGRCVYASTRLPGDKCEWSGQCASGRCDLLTNKCVATMQYTAKKGERCGVALGPEGTTVDCMRDNGERLKCLQEQYMGRSYGFCYSALNVRVGESCVAKNNETKLYNICESDSLFCNGTTGLCTSLLNDGAYCEAHAQCRSGDCALVDVTNVASGMVCKTLKKTGETCTSSVQCSNKLTCRPTVAKGERRCNPYGALGEYCSTDADCDFNRAFTFGGNTITTELTVCANSKCIRQNGVINGEKCERNANCHSGNCDVQSGTCKNAVAQKCTTPTAGTCDFCACQTADSGLCLATTASQCPGYLLDLQICLYNNFMYNLNDPNAGLYYGLASRSGVDAPFLDTESSAYKVCGAFYNNYLKCLLNGDKWKVAEINGFSLTGTPTPNVIMPKVLSSSNIIARTSLVIVALIATVLAMML